MAGESRQALLGRVVDHLVGAGVADLSLRQLAAAVGSSHRMLLYHFGSSENLLEAVVLEVEQRTRAWFFAVAEPEDASLAELSLLLWHRASSEELEPLVRLFFALYARMVERSQTTELTDKLITSWLDPIVASLAGRGVPVEGAAELARLGLAVTRGLLLDVLATGDRPAADAAMRAYVHALFPSDTRLRFEIFPTDLDETAAFYVGVLGFDLKRDERHAAQPYLALQRGAVRIGAAARPEVVGREQRRPPTGVEVVLEVDDVVGERQRVADAGWPLVEELQARPWGLRDFRLLDPSGYYLRITEQPGSRPRAAGAEVRPQPR